MSTQLYKIVFNKSSFELNDDYERLSEYEKEIISSMPVDAFFDYDCDDDYTCFLQGRPFDHSPDVIEKINNFTYNCDFYNLNIQNILEFDGK